MNILVYLSLMVICLWLPMLTDRIAHNRKAIVCPMIDVIDHDNFGYETQAGDAMRGAFDWEMYYKRIPIPAQLQKNDPSEPFEWVLPLVSIVPLGSDHWSGGSQWLNHRPSLFTSRQWLTFIIIIDPRGMVDWQGYDGFCPILFFYSSSTWFYFWLKRNMHQCDFVYPSNISGFLFLHFDLLCSKPLMGHLKLQHSHHAADINHHLATRQISVWALCDVLSLHHSQCDFCVTSSFITWTWTWASPSHDPKALALTSFSALNQAWL